MTAIPRSVFAGEIDRSTQRVFVVTGAMALLAAATAVLLANLVLARPLRRLAGQLRAVEHFELDAVRHTPTLLVAQRPLAGLEAHGGRAFCLRQIHASRHCPSAG